MDSKQVELVRRDKQTLEAIVDAFLSYHEALALGDVQFCINENLSIMRDRWIYTKLLRDGFVEWLDQQLKES